MQTTISYLFVKFPVFTLDNSQVLSDVKDVFLHSNINGEFDLIQLARGN